MSDGAARIFLHNYTNPNFRKATDRWNPRGSLFRKIKIVVESGGDSFDVPMFRKLSYNKKFYVETILKWTCSKCSRLLLLMVSFPDSNFLLNILGLFSRWRANSNFFIDPSPNISFGIHGHVRTLKFQTWWNQPTKGLNWKWLSNSTGQFNWCKKVILCFCEHCTLYVLVSDFTSPRRIVWAHYNPTVLVQSFRYFIILNIY